MLLSVSRLNKLYDGKIAINIRKKRRSGSLHLLLQMEFMVCWERMAQERQALLNQY